GIRWGLPEEAHLRALDVEAADDGPGFQRERASFTLERPEDLEVLARAHDDDLARELDARPVRDEPEVIAGHEGELVERDGGEEGRGGRHAVVLHGQREELALVVEQELVRLTDRERVHR